MFKKVTHVIWKQYQLIEAQKKKKTKLQIFEYYRIVCMLSLALNTISILHYFILKYRKTPSMQIGTDVCIYSVLTEASITNTRLDHGFL